MKLKNDELEKALTLFVVEYSVSTDAFHTRSLRKVLSNNLITVSKGDKSDYLPVGIFKNREDADKFVYKVGIKLAKSAQRLTRKDGTRNFVRISEIIESVVRSVNKMPSPHDPKK